MASDASGDDSFMHRLALDLVRKHEDAIKAQGSTTADPVAGIDDTLTAALMATRHVIVWHVGHEPSPDEIATFARRFPDWALVDAECAIRLGAGQGRAQAADRPCSDIDLVSICRRFLAAYAFHHLGEAGSSVGTQALRARLASGNKRT